MGRIKPTAAVKTEMVDNLAALDNLAVSLAGRLRGGEVINLLGDLGAGKTAFVRCLARHLQSIDAVASPSFTIENVYRSPKMDIHHFDFYRLKDPGVCAFELAEVLGEPDKLIIVEWGGIVADILPAKRLSVEIEAAPTAAEPERRQFVFRAPAALQYLLSGLRGG